MKVQPDCFPCILRRVLATARRITDDTWLQQKVLGKAMAELADADRDLTPAELVAETYTHVAKTLGTADPFHKEREHWFQELAGFVDKIHETIEQHDDPLLAALAFSARANAFDDETLSQGKIRSELNRLGLKKEDDAEPEMFSFCEDYGSFAKDLGQSKTLLFIHDSGPELFFDRLVIDQLVAAQPKLEVTSVVRSAPILLDATREDCETTGLAAHPAVKAIIDPGTPSLGCPPNECTREFRETLDGADLVLAKGQAQIQTLSDANRRIYFLARIKCAVMAQAHGAKRGATILIRE